MSYTATYEKWNKTLDDYEPGVLEPFATYAPHRSPAYKLHKSYALAKSALSNHPYGSLWEYGFGKWTEIVRKVPKPDCDECGQALMHMVKTYYGDQERNSGKGVWDRRNFREFLWVCPECYGPLAKKKPLKAPIAPPPTLHDNIIAIMEAAKHGG